MIDKKLYIRYCQENPDVPLFFTPVWLDLVTQGNWEGAVYLNNENRVVAIMPLHTKSKYGLTAIVNPKLSPYQGIYYHNLNEIQTEQKKQSFIFKVCREFLKDIHTPALYKVRFHPSFQMWLPFYFTGYRQTTFYSYILENIAEHEVIFSGFKYNTKNIIRQAEIELSVRECSDMNVFFELVKKTFAQKKETLPFELNFLEKLVVELKENCQFLIAVNAQEKAIACMCLVYDKQTAYNIIFGTDFQHVKTGAPSFLIWEGIKIASKRVNRFDFEGSRLPTIQPFYQAFGGKPTPYFEISKAGNLFWKTIFTLGGKF